MVFLDFFMPCFLYAGLYTYTLLYFFIIFPCIINFFEYNVSVIKFYILYITYVFPCVLLITCLCFVSYIPTIQEVI